MKKIIIPIIGSLILLTLSISVHAQTPTGSEKNTTTKYNISFPITELGNCSDLTSCKAYCDDATHQEACIAYAKEKGFYKDQNTSDATNQTLLDAAKSELGCDSLDACKTLCEDSTNYTKCSNFAKEHNISNESKDAGSSSILEKAKEVLGCDSKESCKELCSVEANQQKCSDFAKENGLKGGTQKVGPGGCTSQSSCSTYCSDATHATECQQFRNSISSDSAKPNPSFPPRVSENPSVTYRPNPSEHPGYNSYYTPTVTKYPIPEHATTGTPPTSPTIAFYQNYCNSHPNCTWTDNKCQCASTTPTTTEHFNGQYTPTPTSAVKGVSTHVNFFEGLFEFILGKLK